MCGGALGLGLLLLFVRRGRHIPPRKDGADLHSSLLDIAPTSSGPQEFTLAQLGSATNNFSDGCKLAEGGFGAVYRGRLRPSGVAVAIKVLRPEAAAVVAPNKKAEQYIGVGGFHREREVLTKYRHWNIVELLGTCLSDDQTVKQCLVLEFVAGGSLKSRLASGTPPLTVAQRFDIASDVARALRFLHGVATPPIIHQDVKSDNILLDVIQGELVAKLADFGTARYADELLNTGVSKVVTGNVIGSRGYMPVEYQSGVVSEKTDTYAFGVVLFELLTASPPISADGEMLGPSMCAQLDSSVHALPPLLDARPGVGEWQLPRASALGRIACRCTASLARQRCIVTEVLPELDELAGRAYAKLAKRGEEFDPYTGKLIRRNDGHGRGRGGGGATRGGGMLVDISTKTS